MINHNILHLIVRKCMQQNPHPLAQIMRPIIDYMVKECIQRNKYGRLFWPMEIVDNCDFLYRHISSFDVILLLFRTIYYYIE